MQQAFGGADPLLRFNDLADKSDQDEQTGFMMMFSGAVAGLRNPRAHKLIKDDPERALEFVAFGDTGRRTGRLNIRVKSCYKAEVWEERMRLAVADDLAPSSLRAFLDPRKGRMAGSLVVSALVDKRAEIAGRIRGHSVGCPLKNARDRLKSGGARFRPGNGLGRTGMRWR
jgi:hypothetical protein